MATRREMEATFQREQLHWAASKGDAAEVQRLLARKYPVNRFDRALGWTPLHHAVRQGHLDVVDVLLAAGADVNAHDERRIGQTPLGDNITECSFEMARRLIEAGADPTIRGWMQLSAIDRAAERTDADAKKVRRLLADAGTRLQKEVP